jgi:membrane-bound metal-dependent hydrolase YbcI (DUF457 family)
MPGYKGHLAGGLITGILTAGTAVAAGHAVHTPLQIAGIVSFCLLGALFPDVDTDSKGQNLFYSIFILVDGTLIFQQNYRWAAWLGLFAMFPALGHHRGWTHTWWAMLLVGAPIFIFPGALLGIRNITIFFLFYLAFTAGYFSHLLLDRRFF